MFDTFKFTTTWQQGVKGSIWKANIGKGGKIVVQFAEENNLTIK